MVNIVYRKNGLIPIRHVWFDNEGLESSACITFYHGVSRPFATSVRKRKKVEKQYSLQIDLTLNAEAILEQMRKNVRYEIRRSNKEAIIIKHFTSKEIPQELLNRFEVTYNEMYRDKGLAVKYNCRLVEAYMQDNCIEFSVGFAQGTPIVFHSYIVDTSTARFFYSTSPLRKKGVDSSLVSRVNRYQHWSDICYFKQLGYKIYDFGGISNPQKPNGIDNFKLGFGGNIVEYYNLVVYSGLFGAMYSLIENI